MRTKLIVQSLPSPISRTSSPYSLLCSAQVGYQPGSPETTVRVARARAPSTSSAMSDPTTRMSRCQCGEVVMELTGRPIASINCHCNICQNWSGAPYLWMVLFLSENVDVVKGKGNLTVTQTTDAVDRARCKSCTSHVYNSSKGGKMFVVPGVYIQGIRNEDRTFAKGFAPSAEIFYGERVSDTNLGLPTYDGFPAEKKASPAKKEAPPAEKEASPAQKEASPPPKLKNKFLRYGTD